MNTFKYLARVLASLQISSAEHGISDHARVGVVAVTVRQNGNIQALQPVTANCWGINADLRKTLKMHL